MSSITSSNSSRKSSKSQSQEFVISTPVRHILVNPITAKVLVPLSGRSHEVNLGCAYQDHKKTTSCPGKVKHGAQAEELGLESLCNQIFLSVQAQKQGEQYARVCYDAIFRLGPGVQSAHILSKIVYKNCEEVVRELGPYNFDLTLRLKSFRLEQMNVLVSPETKHYHIYFMFQVISYQLNPESEPSAPAPTKGDNLLSPTSHHPHNKHRISAYIDDSALLLTAPHSCNPLPDFRSHWGPLARLKVTAGAPPHAESVYAVPELLMLTCTEFRDLLTDEARRSGETVLADAHVDDLLLLLQLTFPASPTQISSRNVQQVLRIAQRFGAPSLKASAEQFLCLLVEKFGFSQLSKLDLAQLANDFDLEMLVQVLDISKSVNTSL